MNPDNHTWDLLVGALKGTLGEAEQREFDRWAAEAENRRFYNNLTRVWREIQQRAAAYEPDRDRLWRQLQQRIGTYEIPHADQLPKRRRSHLLQMAIAVAAACRDAMETFKKKQKASELTEDDLKIAEKDLQKLTDDMCKERDALLEKKEKELMEV